MINLKPTIAVRKLSCHFGKKVAVDNLELDVHSGEVFGILGHNGAGKTTIVRLLNGLLPPSAGHISVMGLNPTTEGAVLRRYTGVLTETPALEELLTARDNLRIYARLYNVPHTEITGKIEKLLHTFGLTDHADEKVRRYSKGMKQRLALARALLHDPDLLFLDEPTEGLDPLAAYHVRDLITELSREKKRTILLCTHNLVEAQQLCDHVAVLEHGRLLALGTPTGLIRQLTEHMTQRLEVEVLPHNVAAALDILQTVPDIIASSDGHNTITVQGAKHEIIPALISMLTNAGIEIYKVLPHESSLEDVYFALHDKKGGPV